MSRSEAPSEGHRTQPELALCRPQLGDIDMQETDQAAFEAAFLGPVAVHIQEPRNAMALEAPAQVRSLEVRDRRLQGIETVCPAEATSANRSQDDGLFLLTWSAGARLFGSISDP